VLVEFQQAYESDSFRSRRRKQQVWRRQADRWKIDFEAKSWPVPWTGAVPNPERGGR
jgi:hypothetical protein